MKRVAAVRVKVMPATSTLPTRIKAELVGTSTSRMVETTNDFYYWESVAKEMKKYKVKVLGFFSDKNYVIVVKPGDELGRFFREEKIDEH